MTPTPAQQFEAFQRTFRDAVRAQDRGALEGLFHERYYLVDGEGCVIDRKQVIDRVLARDSSLGPLFSHARGRTTWHAQGDTIREVSEVRPVEQPDQASGAGARADGCYVYHATYVRGTAGGLRVLGTTITRSVEPGQGRS